MKQAKNNNTRSMSGTIRAMEGKGNERRFQISFSSEEPYERWFGAEILSHEAGAVDLARLNDMGVVLFNHDTNKVIGRVLRAWIEDERGCAEIEFDEDDFSEMIRQKVAKGTLKGVSVRYTVGSWEEVKAGNISSNGRHKGPCSIAVKWKPSEVSIVPVPADATVGVGRGLEPEESSISFWERQVAVNRNYLV